DGGQEGRAAEVGADRSGVFQPFEVPDRRLVFRIVLPPGETEAAAAAGACRTGHAAATSDPVGIAVKPDDIPDTFLGDHLWYPGTLHEVGQALGLGRRGSWFEPGKQRVDAFAVGDHAQPVRTAPDRVTDAGNKVSFRLVAQVVALRHDDHTFT